MGECNSNRIHGFQGRRTMKNKVVQFIVLFLVVISFSNAGIISVSIVPAEPTINDSLTILTEGYELVGPIAINNSVLTIEDSSLALDLYLDLGVLQVETPWDHEESIGYLPWGTYDLTVNAIYAPDVTDTFTTSFEVVPEPTTLLLLLCGIPLLRKRNR